MLSGTADASALLLRARGEALLALDRLSDAAHTVDAAIRLAAEADGRQPDTLASSLTLRADIALAQGDLAAADGALARTIAVRKSAGADANSLAEAEVRSADVKLRLGQLAAAHALIDAASSSLGEAGERSVALRVHVIAAAIAAAEANPDLVRQEAGRAQEILDSGGDEPDDATWARLSLAATVFLASIPARPSRLGSAVWPTPKARMSRH